jgi:hypothetical protein
VKKKKKKRFRPPLTEEEIQRRQEEQEKQLRKNIRKLVNGIVRYSKSEYVDVWRKLKHQFNGESVTNASIDGLKEREKVLLEWEDKLMTELGNQDWYRKKDELYDCEDYEELCIDSIAMEGKNGAF